MNQEDMEIESRLAAPGAGLPKIELWVARWIFANARRKMDRRKAVERIASERASLLGIARSLTSGECARRVLIPRLRGLEDSSRYWSVYMTLEHLRIVNEAVSHVIVELSDRTGSRGRGEYGCGKAGLRCRG